MEMSLTLFGFLLVSVGVMAYKYEQSISKVKVRSRFTADPKPRNRMKNGKK